MAAVDIANSALTKLGERTIVALTDSTAPAAACNARIEDCRRAVLRAHPWNFATTRTTLSLKSVTNVVNNGSGLCRVTVSSHGFTTGDKVSVSGVLGTAEANGTWTVTVIDPNTFDLQSSAFVNTYSSGGVAGLAAEYNWSYRLPLPSDFLRLLEVNSDSESWRLESGYILTMDPGTEIKYVYDCTDYDLMDQLFKEAYATYLAWDICYRVTKNLQLKNQILQDYEGLMKRAKFVNATEEHYDRVDAEDWLDNRLAGATQYVRDPMT